MGANVRFVFRFPQARRTAPASVACPALRCACDTPGVLRSVKPPLNSPSEAFPGLLARPSVSRVWCSAHAVLTAPWCAQRARYAFQHTAFPLRFVAAGRARGGGCWHQHQHR